MAVIRVGIMPQEKIRELTIKIAKGEIERTRNMPTVWFPSLKHASEVLSDHNRELLHAIKNQKPQSIRELAEITNRKPNNVSRTINNMAKYGIVKVEKHNHRNVPIAIGTEFLIQM